MITVVIPTLDEEETIGRSLAALGEDPTPHETIVVDGGSRDATVRIAETRATVLHAPRGRARQMNAGARRGKGDILLFLHADCVLEEGALADVEKLLGGTAAVGGCFRQRIQARGLLYRAIETGANLRARWMPYFYGDSGIFVRRDVFERIGGFPEIPIMEEVGLTRAMRRAGPVRLLPRRIFISPRRWEAVGTLRTTIRNWIITVRYHLGVTPEILARNYPEIRGTGSSGDGCPGGFGRRSSGSASGAAGGSPIGEAVRPSSSSRR
jgi:rSAM/selenodomain-associated transferase 2